MRLRYTERARNDLEFAFTWYERQRRGLGFEFLDCIEVAILAINDFPEMCEISHSNLRRFIIRRFPFSIFYSIEKAEIIVHAVFDNRQDPEKRP
ncbi:MAG: type II toxin-antitoxin system RelE/ParE family toxin [Calditrichia bacterium]